MSEYSRATLRTFQSTLPVRGATHSKRICAANSLFQSTLPVRGATGAGKGLRAKACNFNPRSPCGERRNVCGHNLAFDLISIHAPRAGSDREYEIPIPKTNTFQSTLPVRGATAVALCVAKTADISIHAPRAGSDNLSSARRSASSDFNPRSPCGERRAVVLIVQRDEIQFQSTLPVRGATAIGYILGSRLSISIHAPRAGSDAYLLGVSLSVRNFNPRSPCGERLTKFFDWFIVTLISIHAPRAGSDSSRSCPLSASCDFNPRSPCGERLH